MTGDTPRRSVYDVPTRDLSPADAAALGVIPRPCEECARLAAELADAREEIARLKASRAAASRPE